MKDVKNNRQPTWQPIVMAATSTGRRGASKIGWMPAGCPMAGRSAMIRWTKLNCFSVAISWMLNLKIHRRNARMPGRSTRSARTRRTIATRLQWCNRRTQTIVIKLADKPIAEWFLSGRIRMVVIKKCNRCSFLHLHRLGIRCRNWQRRRCPPHFARMTSFTSNTWLSPTKTRSTPRASATASDWHSADSKMMTSTSGTPKLTEMTI